MAVQKGLFLLAVALITTATAANSIVNVTDLYISADNPVVQAGASGAGVVDAVVNLIYHSCIFPEDYLFLRRLAFVETRDGTVPYTYEPNYAGIWRVSQSMFQRTQMFPVSAALQAKFRQIEDAFGIVWQNVQWHDLQKPLYSALAAMLYITFSERPVPSSSEEQATFRHTLYQLSGSESNFTRSVENWNGACSPTEQADVVFVIDSATSNDNFRRVLSYIGAVVDGLTLGSELIRVSLYQFGAGNLRNEFRLTSFSQVKTDIKAAIGSTSQMAGAGVGASDTGYFLESVLSDAFGTSGRANAARIVILVTDNQPSNMGSMQTARNRAVHDGVSVFMVGVGTGTALLNSLSTVATQPTCDHQIRVDQFQHLKDIVQETQFKICKEPMMALGMIRCRLDQCRNVAFPMSSSQMTIRANTTCDSGNIYVSPRTPRPDQYFRDVADSIVTTSADVASVSIIANSPYLYVTFVDATPGISNCYALIQAVNGIPTTTQTPCTTDYPYPTTNPCLTVGRTKDRFPYPYSTSVFIQCDLQNDMYITRCPPDRPFYNQDCTYCVGASSPILSGCTTPTTNDYCGLVVNPCTEENIRNNRFFFACPSNEREYLQCDMTGRVYIKSCPENEVWREGAYTCEVLPFGLVNPCNGLSRFFPYPNNNHMYIMCNENQIPFVMPCLLNFIWDQADTACVPPDNPFSGVTRDSHIVPLATTQTSIVIGTGGTISKGFAFPCTRENIQADHLYFPYSPDENKYIQCDLWGDAFLRSCQPGFYFFPESSTCV